ncbi:MT0933-like antitoxin protein [Austwickia chelonae]|nr:antitoxin [Austwickia chelonae]SEW30601.1 MT0933-like antitoxin protein [Austwickia chelonae]
MDFSSLVNKAKGFAQDNPDKVRAGLDKVEDVVNERTGGKYADQVAKGAGAVENALGVPGRAKQAFLDEMGPEGEGAKPDPVKVDPVESSGPIDPPSKI